MPSCLRSFFALALITLLLLFNSGCEQQKKQYDYTIFAFGTLIDVSLFAEREQQAQAAFAQLQKDFERFHQDWSPWVEGDLARLNRQLAKKTGPEKSVQAIEVPEHLLPIIRQSFRLSQQSNNLYNPTIGRLINLWQFHRYQEKDIRPPAEKKIQALLAQNPKMSDMQLQGKQLINHNPAVSLNFGAFAKGYAIGLEMKKLQKLGINNAVINAGGDLSVIGNHGDRAWNIGIRHPRKQQLLASVEARSNESVFTSGDYERYYFYNGRRYHHILDPRTGYPATGAQSVTVIHADPGLADAAATALFVAGRDQWREIATKMGLDYVMLVDSEGEIYLTKSMKQRIKLFEKSATLHIIE